VGSVLGGIFLFSLWILPIFFFGGEIWRKCPKNKVAYSLFFGGKNHPKNVTNNFPQKKKKINNILAN
jgi:hypothetical protein